MSIAATDNAGAEAGSDPIVFTVTRGGNIWSNVVVNLGWTGTATFGTDYTATVDRRNAGRQRTDTHPRARRHIGDGDVDAGRRCRRRGDRDADRDPCVRHGLHRRRAVRARAGRSSTTTSPRSSSVAATDAAGAEQGSDPIVFTITRSASLTNQVVVNLTWSGAAVFGTDYTVTVTGGTLSANGSTLTLPAGSTGATITVRPVDDTAVESAESVVLGDRRRAPATHVGSPASATGTITDNDVRTISVSDATVTEGNKSVTVNVTVTLSSASTTSVTVVVTTVAGTALAGSDFTAKTSTLTFNPGVTSLTFSVTITGDTKAEPTETFTVVLSSPNGAAIGRGTGTVTIIDNDGRPGSAAVRAGRPARRLGQRRRPDSPVS